MSTSYRHWLLLRMIPRYLRKIDSVSIAELLDRQGITIHRRTIHIYLERHSDIFPLSCDDWSKPSGWSWRKDELFFDGSKLSLTDALAFSIDDYLSSILPMKFSPDSVPNTVSRKPFSVSRAINHSAHGR